METNSIRKMSRTRILGLLNVSTLMLLISACANMGAGPQGGPKDENPPKYIQSTPAINQKSYNSQKITIYFDEYVSLKDPYSRVVVSPPQSTQASISALGKKVTVELSDSLEENRTYIIDFANSIADNNEGNEIKDFYISFSTGTDIDSFEVSGKVIDARTLAPVEGLYVGAYENPEDTAFTNSKMDYVAKTNANGSFRLRGLKEREYSIFGLKDNNSNFKFDDKGEGIAVLGHRIKTTRTETSVLDTIYKDSTAIDTIVERKVRRFEPDSLLMLYYTEAKHLQYFKNATWYEKDFFTLNFVNERKALPSITPMNFECKDCFCIEPGLSYDTLNYWFNDTIIAQKDTLKFTIEYEKTDSIGNFVQKKDTITLLAKKWKNDKKFKGPDFSISNKVHFYKNPVLSWDYPLMHFDEKQITLKHKKDSTWDTIPCRIAPVPSSPRHYQIVADFEEGETYKVVVDSGMVRNLLGKTNKEAREGKFSIRSKTEYTKLDFKIKNTNTNAFVELLSQKEEVVRTEEVKNGLVSFENIEPGDYYVRLFEDKNNDREWTTGDYLLKKSPEPVYYYPKKLTLKANWEREEDWDITELEITKQRPNDLGTLKKKQAR